MPWDDRKSRFRDLVALLFALMLLVAGCTEDISQPVENIPVIEDQDYYPMLAGSIHVYASAQDSTDTQTYITESVQVTEEGRIAIEAIYSGVSRTPFIARWSTDRLYITFENHGPNPLTAIDLPLFVGKRWTKVNSSEGSNLNIIHSDVISLDTTLTVPAGTFSAVMIRDIHQTRIGNNTEAAETTYFAYAKDVGLIQMGFGADAAKLRSFTPGEPDDTTSGL